MLGGCAEIIHCPCINITRHVYKLQKATFRTQNLAEETAAKWEQFTSCVLKVVGWKTVLFMQEKGR